MCPVIVCDDVRHVRKGGVVCPQDPSFASTESLDSVLCVRLMGCDLRLNLIGIASKMYGSRVATAPPLHRSSQNDVWLTTRDFRLDSQVSHAACVADTGCDIRTQLRRLYVECMSLHALGISAFHGAYV